VFLLIIPLIFLLRNPIKEHEKNSSAIEPANHKEYGHSNQQNALSIH
jgi:hypothetical protein